jgi:hypothetical protein
MLRLNKVILYRLFFLCLLSGLLAATSNAQKDTAKAPKVAVSPAKEPVVKDSLMRRLDSIAKRFNPRVATRRSAIIPGWGQIYNRKYWKLPIVYGALGICGYVFFDNLKTYKDYRFAYKAKVLAAGIPPDSSLYRLIKPEYLPLQPQTLRTGRDQFRKYIDYSALIFVLLWGLNVVDATVDAHLKTFDVSPDLTFKFRPGPSEMAGTTGISLIVAFK